MNQSMTREQAAREEEVVAILATIQTPLSQWVQDELDSYAFHNYGRNYITSGWNGQRYELSGGQ